MTYLGKSLRGGLATKEILSIHLLPKPEHLQGQAGQGVVWTYLIHWQGFQLQNGYWVWFGSESRQSSGQ